MSDISPSESRQMGRRSPNRKGAGDKWAHLDDETREQYEAIEARVRDKVARGEL